MVRQRVDMKKKMMKKKNRNKKRKRKKKKDMAMKMLDNILLQGLQQALPMGRLFCTQGDEGHDQHSRPASRYEAAKHQNLCHSTLTPTGRGAVH